MIGIAALLLVGVVVAAFVVFGSALVSPRIVAPIAQVAGVAIVLGGLLSFAVTAIPLLVDAPATVTVPLHVMAPHAARGITIDPAPAHIVGGGVDRATLELTGLSVPTRALLVASDALQAATAVLLGIIVVRLARSLAAGDPFRVGFRSLSTASIVLLAGGTAWTVLGDLGAWRAGQEALAVPGWSASKAYAVLIRSTDDIDGILSQYGWPRPADLTLTLPLWPLGAALGLALLAAVFRAGVRLRRDTEGLV